MCVVLGSDFAYAWHMYSSLKRAVSVNAITQTFHGLAQLLKSVKYIASLEVLIEV
jgi:hypothetical protein